MKYRKWLTLMLCGTLCLCMVGCGGGAPTDDTSSAVPPPADDTFSTVPPPTGDLTADITPKPVEEKETDGTFESGYMQFAVELLKAETAGKKENVLVSPLSVELALAMTANGAAGDTLTEMEQVLGDGISIADLNGYLHTWMKGLTASEKSRLQTANSIWLRDNESLTVQPSFLQTNADYYNAGVYKRPFDRNTVEEINRWVKEHTDGTIDRIVETIDADSMLYLINALAFDAKWDEPYEDRSVKEGTFTSVSGEQQTAQMMMSVEYTYLNDGRATGFAKYYEGYDYSFAALLPNEGVSIHDYVDGLTANTLRQTLLGMGDDSSQSVIAHLPKFSYDYGASLRRTLGEMGMPTAFDGDRADFSAMGHVGPYPLYIGDVQHKTFITVDALGTKAGAVTAVDFKCGSAMIEPKEVTLDRPFVYMIVDNTTYLPVFIGTVMEIN